MIDNLVGFTLACLLASTAGLLVLAGVSVADGIGLIHLHSCEAVK